MNQSPGDTEEYVEPVIEQIYCNFLHSVQQKHHTTAMPTDDSEV